jgi:transposase-like protein
MAHRPRIKYSPAQKADIWHRWQRGESMIGLSMLTYRVERSHEMTRVRERGMRKFKTMNQAQRFVTFHAAVYNLFNLGRHLVSANLYRNLRIGAFTEWSRAVA